MHTGELYHRIRLLGRDEVSSVKPLPDIKGTQTLGHPFIVYLQQEGVNAFMKPPYSYSNDLSRSDPVSKNYDPDITKWSSIMEANVLYALQGVTCVPKLYGVMTEHPKGIGNAMWDYEGAIVEQLAGPDLSRTMGGGRVPLASSNEGSSFLCHLPSIADYFSESLKRGLINLELKSGDIFLADDLGSGLLVVDYGFVVHASKMDSPTIGERHAYTKAIENMLALNLVLVANSSLGGMNFGAGAREDRKLDTAQKMREYFKNEGLATLASLMDSYAQGKFKEPNYRTLLDFLSAWKRGIEEQCKYLSEAITAEDATHSSMAYPSSTSVSKQVEAGNTQTLEGLAEQLYRTNAQEFELGGVTYGLTASSPPPKSTGHVVVAMSNPVDRYTGEPYQHVLLGVLNLEKPPRPDLKQKMQERIGKHLSYGIKELGLSPIDNVKEGYEQILRDITRGADITIEAYKLFLPDPESGAQVRLYTATHESYDPFNDPNSAIMSLYGTFRSNDSPIGAYDDPDNKGFLDALNGFFVDQMGGQEKWSIAVHSGLVDKKKKNEVWAYIDQLLTDPTIERNNHGT